MGKEIGVVERDVTVEGRGDFSAVRVIEDTSERVQVQGVEKETGRKKRISRQVAARALGEDPVEMAKKRQTQEEGRLKGAAGAAKDKLVEAGGAVVDRLRGEDDEDASLEEKYEKLAAAMLAMQERLDELEQRNQSLEQEKDNLEQKNIELRDRIESLEGQLADAKEGRGTQQKGETEDDRGKSEDEGEGKVRLSEVLGQEEVDDFKKSYQERKEQAKKLFGNQWSEELEPGLKKAHVRAYLDSLPKDKKERLPENSEETLTRYLSIKETEVKREVRQTADERDGQSVRHENDTTSEATVQPEEDDSDRDDNRSWKQKMSDFFSGRSTATYLVSRRPVGENKWIEERERKGDSRRGAALLGAVALVGAGVVGYLIGRYTGHIPEGLEEQVIDLRNQNRALLEVYDPNGLNEPGNIFDPDGDGVSVFEELEEEMRIKHAAIVEALGEHQQSMTDQHRELSEEHNFLGSQNDKFHAETAEGGGGVGESGEGGSNELLEVPGETFVNPGEGYTQVIQDVFPGHTGSEYYEAHKAAVNRFGKDYLVGVPKYVMPSGDWGLARTGNVQFTPAAEQFLQNFFASR